MSLVDVANGIEMHGVVKSVQRGYIDKVNVNETELVAEDDWRYLDVTISSVNINKCVVLINQAAAESNPVARLVSNNTLRIRATGKNANIRYYYHFDNVNWQVIEFY